MWRVINHHDIHPTIEIGRSPATISIKLGTLPPAVRMVSRLGGLLKIVKQNFPGPLPSFAPYHLLLVIQVVGQSSAVGRQALAKSTGLGEGAIRTVLTRLKLEGYIVVSASGCSLTSKGERLYSELKSSMSAMMALRKTPLTVGEHQVAIVVRGAAHRVTNGIDQRDAAIKAGADGATTFVIRGQKFQVPGGSKDCESDYPDDAWRVLRNDLEPSEGDAVIICGSSHGQLSKIGALSAALSLLQRA